MSRLNEVINDKPVTATAVKKVEDLSTRTVSNTSVRFTAEEMAFLDELQIRIKNVMRPRNKDISKSEAIRILLHYSAQTEWLKDKHIKEVFHDMLLS